MGDRFDFLLLTKSLAPILLALLVAACGPAASDPTLNPPPLGPTPQAGAEFTLTPPRPADPATPSPTSSSSDPALTATLQADWGPASTIELSQNVDMVPGDVVAVQGTTLEILLVEAHGPGPDCHDCPNSALLLARSGGQIEELKYTFSGNMLLELLEKAKRKEAFGYVLIATRIDDDMFTLRVEPNSS